MTKIARYIDDPPSFFFWEIDEIIVFSLFLGLGLILNILTYLIIVGILLTMILQKTKKSKSEGFFLHVLYWYFGVPLRGFPPSWARVFFE